MKIINYGKQTQGVRVCGVIRIRNISNEKKQQQAGHQISIDIAHKLLTVDWAALNREGDPQARSA